MSLTTLIPAAAVVLFVLCTLAVTIGVQPRHPWRIAAVASAVFFAFSVYTIAEEGPLGFWAEHTRSLWGNQVWVDLLLAVSIGWVLIAPQARALGMRLAPWLVLVASTGCVGFLAMLARMLYLRERADVRADVARAR